MGLQTTMTTSLTGMTAAETTIDVVGNNVANANTVGFKQSDVSFATQFLQTQSIGSGPTESRGGTNPRQVGLGVKVAEITPDFTQGTVEISSNPLDLAIQGDGFFIVQGPQGEQFYTRNGQFKTNANNEIVTTTGQRVLGFSVDENFEIQPTGLVPLSIPLGAAAVAQATENVKIKGDLDPEAVVGDIPQEITSGVLSDGRKAVPDGAPVDLTPLARPTVDTTTVAVDAAVGDVDIGTYQYRIAFVDADGIEGPASAVMTLPPTVANNQTLLIDNIPSPPAGMTNMRIYRANTAGPAANQQFRLVNSAPTAAASSYTDITNDTAIAGAAILNTEGLDDGSYSYYVTFFNGAGESRPTAVLGPVTADATNAPKIWLQDLPRPDNDPDTGGYDGIRIYRNLSNDPNSFHQVGELSAGTISSLFGTSDPISFMDTKPDLSIATAPEVNLDGPPISNVVPLVSLVQRDGSVYTPLFEPGVLSFTANKGDNGGQPVATREFTITPTTTVIELMDFMENTMGIVQVAPEDSFPTSAVGGSIDVTDGSRIKFTSNMGVANAVGINLTAFKLTPTGAPSAETVPLRFTTTQEANGEGATVDATVYDSLGTPLQVRLTTVLEEKNAAGAVFRWIATSADTHPDSGATVVGTGLFTTGSDGAVFSVSEDRISVDRGDSPAESPVEIKLDFSQIRALFGNGNELNQGETDGSPAGTLTSFIITDSGLIQGVFSNGDSRDLGQIRMAQFSNNSGLEQIGDNMFTTGVNSGLPIFGDPGSQGIGTLSAGAVELSNTDIGQNLIELILASTQYRGGARVITAVQQLLDELLALRR